MSRRRALTRIQLFEQPRDVLVESVRQHAVAERRQVQVVGLDIVRHAAVTQCRPEPSLWRQRTARLWNWARRLCNGRDGDEQAGQRGEEKRFKRLETGRAEPMEGMAQFPIGGPRAQGLRMKFCVGLARGSSAIQPGA